MFVTLKIRSSLHPSVVKLPSNHQTPWCQEGDGGFRPRASDPTWVRMEVRRTREKVDGLKISGLPVRR